MNDYIAHISAIYVRKAKFMSRDNGAHTNFFRDLWNIFAIIASGLYIKIVRIIDESLTELNHQVNNIHVVLYAGFYYSNDLQFTDRPKTMFCLFFDLLVVWDIR